ncbi:MAG TPA: hypothetical protein VNO70_23770, partial [Blastocatellia bacterium]|nr:hypothetical protein [Blastocatellia bacterium]
STAFEVSDALSYIVRRHNVKLGGQARFRITRFDFLPGAGGYYNYASFEDFAQDRPFALTVAAGDPHSRFTGGHFHFYADDAWRVRSNLTLSVGLSYENASQPINSLADRLPESTNVLAPIGRVRGDNNNLAPRFGFAYTPDFRVLGRNIFGFDRTVIRGGVSVAYDQPAYRPLADVAASAPNVLLGVLTSSAGVDIPPFPNVPDVNQLRDLLDQNPGSRARTVLTPDFRSPYAAQWNLSATRDFNDRLILELGYLGTRGVGLIRALDASSSQTGFVRVYASTGRSIYHALQARGEVRLRDSLTGEVAYTFSKLIDDVPDHAARLVGGVGSLTSLAAPALQGFAQDPMNVSEGERAVSSLSRKHAIMGNFVWTLPTGRWQSEVLNRLLGGWKASAVVGVASGAPYTALQHFGYAGQAAIFAATFSDRLGSARPFAANPFAPLDSVAFSNAANAYYRFFLNPDGTPFQSDTGFVIANRHGFYPGTVSEARFVYNDYGVEQAARTLGLAPDAFGQTYAAGRPFGDVGRNTLTGPLFTNVDFAMLKTTKLTEKVSVQFRAEFFNLFNHPSRGVPNFVLENAGGFGFADLQETDAAPRRVRLAVKLLF